MVIIFKFLINMKIKKLLLRLILDFWSAHNFLQKHSTNIPVISIFINGRFSCFRYKAYIHFPRLALWEKKSCGGGHFGFMRNLFLQIIILINQQLGKRTGVILPSFRKKHLLYCLIDFAKEEFQLICRRV